MDRVRLAFVLSVACTALMLSETLAQRREVRPRPFPTPTRETEARPRIPEPVEETPVSSVRSAPSGTPTEETLGFPIYPNAQFLTSYDAGRGQRYFLFGTNSDFATMVQYYRVLLDERGDRVFDEPATHVFEIGRFREESMAFPPGVTIKDYTWNGAKGYLNPSPEGDPERFPTIIQIVPTPPERTNR